MTKRIIAITVLLVLFKLTGCTSFDVNAFAYESGDELVVLAHGLGRSDWAMRKFEKRLKETGYKVCSLNYSTIGENVESVLTETRNQINACVVGAPKIHFIGHSLGGLVIRAYLQNNQDAQLNTKLGAIVLMGTPNKGSELADHLRDSWLMKVGGGISRALMTGDSSLGNKLGELDLNLGVIAGTKSSNLTSEQFEGLNDGLVSVESTKLSSMSDFIAIEVNHTQMRYNVEVMEQAVHFLKRGVFKH
ncbi:MAG: hypothetical protein JXR16_09290 [Bermanella sp.]